MKVLTVIGQKNTGKTTFLTNFIAWLTAEGYHVGSIKFSPHTHALDVEGKDSFKHRKAGAKRSAFITPEGYAVFKDETDISSSRKEILNQFTDLDIVVVEGNLGLEGKKVEFFEYNLQDRKPYALTNHSIHAVITSHALEVPCKKVHPENFQQILDLAETL